MVRRTALRHCCRIPAAILTFWLGAVTTAEAQTAAGRAALSIRVISGEDAVNIIQQGSATAPVVEVRDKNEQPVAGAIVRFAVQRGRATFNGARALSVTTNAAGRAVATGFAPTGPGALQIAASASFQGQTSAIVISQTNVMAAGASAGAGAGAGAAGGSGTSAAAGGASSSVGGGGLSASTLAIVGGGAIGGTVLAKEVLLKAGDSYEGTITGQKRITFTNRNGPGSCSNNSTLTGTLAIALEQKDDGSVTGQAKGQITETQVSTTCQFGDPPGSSTSSEGAFPITGTASSITGSHVETETFQAANNASVTQTETFAFTGSLNADLITGTLTNTVQSTSAIENGFGTVTMPVTLTKQ